MLMAINQQGQKILAQHANKFDKYQCPHCKSKVILKQGMTLIAHFAHKTRFNHHCSKSESVEHYEAKLYLARIYEALNFNVEIEPYCKEVLQYPDIVINQKNAIEVQFSKISISNIIRRTTGLKRIGLNVIWIIKDVPLKDKYVKLSPFQSAFIHPINRTLVTWDSKKFVLILYSHLQHVGGKNFVAQRKVLKFEDIINMTFQSNNVPNFRLSASNIQRYINYCRKRHSVLEPTLSAMYQLNMCDSDVISKLGYVVPHQIYLITHPIEWQLKYLLLRRTLNDNELCKQLLSKVKFRVFATFQYDKRQILNTILREFDYLYEHEGLNVQK